MSANLIFVTGGARSGKSGFAMSLAEQAGGMPIYIATATAGDPEMLERIQRHKDERGDGWDTLEEPHDPAAAISSLKPGGTLVLDCVTLWLTNLLMEDQYGFEGVAMEKTRELISTIKAYDGTAIVVSNEVGLGIVPENALVRLFRDVSGMVNRTIAEAADEAYLVVSGLPVRIKP